MFNHSKIIISIILSLFVLPVVTQAAGPTPYSPPDDSRFWTGDPVPVFSWSTQFGAIAYYLEFDNDNNWTQSLGGIELQDNYFDLTPFLTQAEWDPLVFNLYWRVRAKDFFGHLGEPGEVFHFSKTVLNPPTPDHPLDGTIFKPWSQPVTFMWSTYPNEDLYYMQFSNIFEFVHPYGEFSWHQTYFSTDHYISPDDWHYAYFRLFWRVSAKDIYGNKSPWGPASGFYKLGFRRLMCYGDSITGGFGETGCDVEFDFCGYPPILEDQLQMYDERSSVTSYWFSGGKAEDGWFNLERAFQTALPGIVVMMFGTVDIIDPADCEDGDCRTLERIGQITDVCWSYGLVPVVCTVIPYNPAGGHPKFPDVTVIQSQLDDLNDEIKIWCQTEGVPMVDLDQAMIDAAPEGDLSLLYYDWAHPNNDGYQVIADALEPVIVSVW